MTASEALAEVRLEELQLRRPGRVVDLDDEARPVESQRLDVARDGLSDGLGPPTEDPTELRATDAPAAVVASARAAERADHASEALGERHRLAAHSGHGTPVHLEHGVGASGLGSAAAVVRIT